MTTEPTRIHDLTDHELRDLIAAAFAEMRRRHGATQAAEWAALQAHRLGAADGRTD